MYALTQEQQDIVQCQSPELVVKAFSGTGKTSTLKAYAAARPTQRLLYLAFNRAIRDEAQGTFPNNVTCLTSHQLAYRAGGHHYRKKLQNQLTLPVIADWLNTHDWEFASKAREALNLFLHSGDEQLNVERFKSISRKKSERKVLLDACQSLWLSMQSFDAGSLPMTHDGYLKLYQLSQPNLSSYDGILFDEVQDVNPVTRQIVLTQSMPWVMVGDPHQQIYRFRGAQNAMLAEGIKDKPLLTLTQSFRFGPNVAALANDILNIKGETAILKGHTTQDTVEVWKKQPLTGHYAVLHRTVAGVISTALNHDTCYWIGGVEGYRLSDIEDIYWLARNKTARVKNKRNIAPYKDYGEYCRIAKESEDAEMQQTIKIIDKHEHLPDDLKQLREKAVTDETKAAVTVSTAHRSKGLEWDTVVLHDDFPNLLDDSKIRLPDYYIDELNLMYVAATRAMKSLYINTNLLALTVDSADKDKLKQRLADAHK